MKTLNQIILTILITTLFLTSCSIDNLEQLGKLREDTVITDLSSAKAMLNGIYRRTRAEENQYSQIILYLSTSGTELRPQPTSNELMQFFNNDIKNNGENSALYIFYNKSYGTINLINFFINRLEQGVPNISDKKTKELIAEAKTIRASNYFYLLRVFGQFYDINSEYGMPISTNLIDGFTKLKRKTVKENYDLIISDLKYAIKNVSPLNKERFYVTQTYAEALLAKVYLSKGGNESYLETIKLCEKILTNNTEFGLEPDFKTIFTSPYESKELIFAPFYNKKEISYNMGYFDAGNTSPSDYLKQIADEEDGEINGDIDNFTGYEPRFSFVYNNSSSESDEDDDDYGDDDDDYGFGGDTYFKKYPNDKSPIIRLRLAEVYLMYAEALARTNGDTEKALNALNTVRQRSMPDNPKQYTDKKTFLNDIRIEKLLELNIENGEPWFDLVRYYILEDLPTSTIKPTIVNKNQLIFPIPGRVFIKNNDFGKQNPGYSKI